MEIEEQNKVIAVEKADAEAALAEALPALEEARIALSDLDKNDVTEIRWDRFIEDVIKAIKRLVVLWYSSF